MFGSFILIPQFVQVPAAAGFGFGATVTAAGLFMLPSALIMLVAGPISGWMGGRYGSKLPLLIGTVLACIAFTSLALWHSSHISIYVGTTFMGLGIGFAFAAMANLIVDAVDQSQTGVATGMNTIMRSIGGAIGGQVSASIIAGHVAASGLAEESGYTTGFRGLCSRPRPRGHRDAGDSGQAAREGERPGQAGSARLGHLRLRASRRSEDDLRDRGQADDDDDRPQPRVRQPLPTPAPSRPPAVEPSAISSAGSQATSAMKRKTMRRDEVGDPGEDGPDGVDLGELAVDRAGEEAEQQDPLRGAEVAAVDAGAEDAAEQQRSAVRAGARCAAPRSPP